METFGAVTGVSLCLRAALDYTITAVTSAVASSTLSGPARVVRRILRRNAV
ncbi:hypothetical protein ACTXG6_33500 [Pseudonocardia sp. Cha107L01]|uniref:hypothetical protein n=1 Tax=Pseudonocardia sp. Cha107L01 TaxID=3457576 RepID=UPI00403EAF13